MKRDIKILVIGTSDNVGGAAGVGWNLGQNLLRKGVDVKYIVAYKNSKEPYVYELRKPALLKWLDEHTKYSFTALYRHMLAYFLANDVDFGAKEEIIAHPWYKDADIIHMQNIHGNNFKLDFLKSISMEKKIVWTLHDMWALTGKCVYSSNPNEWNEGYHKCSQLSSQPPMLWDNTKYLWDKKRGVYKSLSNLTVVTPSRWLFNMVSKSILKNQDRTFIPNGIDTDLFRVRSKRRIRSKLGLPQSKKIILFVAQGAITDPRKGWSYAESLINSFKKNSEVMFVCVGGRKENFQKNVKFVDFMKDKENLAEYYSASDLLLFTSLAENCPLVVLEALSTGLPIVAFKEGGVKELFSHEANGYLVRYKNSADLKRGVKYILSLGKVSLVKMREMNRQLALKKYSLPKMTEGYLELYSKILSER